MLATILLIFLLQQLNYNYVSALVLVYALIQSFTYDIKLAMFDTVLVYNYFVSDPISNSAAITLLVLMLWLIISISQTSASISNKAHNSLPLLVLALIAIISLASSNSIISTIVTIEVQSLVLYVVLAFTYANNTNLSNISNTTTQASIDSNSQFGLAYLLNASVATAFLLLGLSYNQPIVIAIALLWKLGAWPMQAWLIPISDAVPKQISAFLLTLSKLGLVIVLAAMSSMITGLLLISSQFNLVIGSVLALYERRYKRLFAWLSLTQTGYFLLAISFVQTANAVAYFEHYFAYTILLLLLFNQSSTDSANLVKSWHINYILVFVIALFSIAGLPPAALFWTKLEFLAQLSSQAVVIALLATLVSSLIYVRLVRIAFFYSHNLL